MGIGEFMFSSDLVKVYLDMTKEMKELQVNFLTHKVPTLTKKQLYPENAENTFVEYPFVKSIFEENFLISSDIITNKGSNIF